SAETLRLESFCKRRVLVPRLATAGENLNSGNLRPFVCSTSLARIEPGEPRVERACHSCSRIAQLIEGSRRAYSARCCRIVEPIQTKALDLVVGSSENSVES